MLYPFKGRITEKYCLAISTVSLLSAFESENLQQYPALVTDDSVNLLLQFIFMCVCLCVYVWSVYLGSKSPAGRAESGNVAVCQDLLIGVWGKDYEG